MIRILFIHANNSKCLFNNACHSDQSNDYLTDAIFLELKSRDSVEVYECPPMLHMYKWSSTKREDLTGLGFAIRKKLEGSSNSLDVGECVSKIRDRFFDVIITDSRTMNPWWAGRGLSPFFDNANILKEAFFESYPKNKIVLLDGEDQPNSILKDFYGKSLYFKRELIQEDPNLFPISYCFPKKLFRKKSFSEKSKLVSTIVPGVKSTYIFRDEEEYYCDYANSKFSLTWKKLGWDCFRHYEVLFSSSLPIFPGIDSCPSLTMVNFPKSICMKILSLDCLKNSDYTARFQEPGLDYYPGVRVEDSISESLYTELQEELQEHTLKYNTSEYISNYILSKV